MATQPAISMVTNTTHIPPDNLARQNKIPLHVPPSLHPDALHLPHELADYSADTHVLMVKEALSVAGKAGERALEIARTTLADRNMTPHAANSLAQKRVTEATAPAIAKMQTVIDRTHEKVTAITEFLKGPKPPSNPAAAVLVTAARTALAAMQPGQRRQVILRAIAKGSEADPITLMALTRCEGFLLGVDDLEMENYRAEWAQKNHPDIVAQHRALSMALERAVGAGSSLVTFSAGLVNNQIAAEARVLAQRSADAAHAAGVE